MLQPLLIEIGVEELPAIPLLNELPNIEAKWLKILQEYRLTCQFEFHYTPRRLVLWHTEFLTTQEDAKEEFFGAPVEIAFKDGNPTPAALGFVKKCGVAIEDVSRATKDGKEVLYVTRTVKGQPSNVVLPQMVTAFIQALSFGKAMRWGSNKESFIRPIRWLSVLLGHQNIPCTLFGVTSTLHTFVHRQHSFEPVGFSDARGYFDVLKEGHVTLFAQDRKEAIIKQFKALEAQHNIYIEIDEGLLDEVIAITEHPVALLGSFDEVFLELPREVIVTSMREHQRYFPVYKNNLLAHYFIVVSNALATQYDAIVKGNEKVLRARLSDALFFYGNDLKRGLLSDGLEKVTYMNGLGSLNDKVCREYAIAKTLLEELQDHILDSMNWSKEEASQHIKRFFEISKADLLTEMVYEFTELQGTMGRYYALKLGENGHVAQALYDQYLPLGEDANLPEESFGALLAIAVKLDAIMGLFSIGQIPTGSRDPFGLRRAANGIIRIAIAYKLPLDLRTLIEATQDHYAHFDTVEVEHFMLERFYPLYETNPSIIKAVMASGERNICELDLKIKAVANVAESENFKTLTSIYKRVANITKDIQEQGSIEISLLLEPQEIALYEAFISTQEKHFVSYEARMDALLGLTQPLAHFFDHVMVNSDNEALKNNRKNLISTIHAAFRSIADIKEISL